MIKLLKYELLRKKKAYVIALSIFAALTLLVAVGLPRLDNNYWVFLVGASSIVLVVGGLLFPFIINTANYYGDYKNRSGFMMFLTPNGGYKIFGSKILAALIDTLVVFILLGLFGLISYSIADAYYGLSYLNELTIHGIMGVQPAWSIIVFAIAAAIIQSISTIILAMFSITVSKTLLAHKSINWFIPLVVFLVLKWIEQMITTIIIAAKNFNDFKELFTNNNLHLDLPIVLIMAIGISLVFATIYTVIASTLINKKLDL